MKRFIIAGSRTFHDMNKASKFIDKVLEGIPKDEIEIVTGGANGADELGKRYAFLHKYKHKEFLADWDKYGKPAGHIRNQQMADYVKQEECTLIAFWDGKSKGTKDMIGIAQSDDISTVICYF